MLAIIHVKNKNDFKVTINKIWLILQNRKKM